MRIREFDLDRPGVSKEERTAFRRGTRSLTALYEREFDQSQIDASGWKILVECVDVVERSEVRNLEGVMTIQAAVDTQSYRDGSEKERQKLALSWLTEGVRRIASEFGWGLDPFLAAEKRITDLDFENERWWGRAKWSPSRAHKADLWCVHGIDSFRAWLVVFDKMGHERARKLVFEELPDEFVFSGALGTIKWLSNECVSLVGKNGVRVGELVLG